jgi:tetratricopeptide (TPR) repeat protein
MKGRHHGPALAAASLVAALLAVRGNVAAAPIDDCNSNDRDKMLLGCSVLAGTSEDAAVLAIALLRRGSVLQDMHRIDAAIADFTVALRMDPKLVAALLLRAQGFSQIGEHQAAFDDFNAVLQLDPNNALAVSGLETEARALGPAAARRATGSKAQP